MSLTRQVARLMLRRLAAVAGFALGLLLVSVVGASVQVQVATSDTPVPAPSPPAPPPPPSAVERLVQTHGCWTGEAPAAHATILPGHVVVTRGDGDAVRSARLVGPALEQALGHADHDLLVHAFCP